MENISDFFLVHYKQTSINPFNGNPASYSLREIPMIGFADVVPLQATFVSSMKTIAHSTVLPEYVVIGVPTYQLSVRSLICHFEGQVCTAHCRPPLLRTPHDARGRPRNLSQSPGL